MQIQLEAINAQKLLAERRELARLEIEEKKRRLAMIGQNDNRVKGHEANFPDGRSQEGRFGQVRGRDQVRGRVHDQKIDQSLKSSLLGEPPLGDGLLPIPANLKISKINSEQRDSNMQGNDSIRPRDLSREDSKQTTLSRSRDDRSGRKHTRWDGDHDLDEKPREKRNRGSRWAPVEESKLFFGLNLFHISLGTYMHTNYKDSQLLW